MNIDSTVNSAAEYLYPKIENMANLDLFAILYQAGYFCIKSVVDDIFKVEVTLKKPEAPISAEFDYVAVSIMRER